MNDYFISVSLIKSQKMQCVVYHNVQKEEDGNNSTHTWKGLFVYDKEHDTIAMNQHVSKKHFVVLNIYKYKIVIVDNVFVHA